MRREALWNRLYLSGIDSRAAELARENGLGLEIAAFCYAPNLEDPAVLSAVRRDMAGVDRFWFHAPFAELAPCAIDPLVRQVTEKRYRQAADMALDLGVRRLIIHGGFVPQVYFPEWYVEQSVIFWRDFLRQLPPDMTIALENVMEPEPRLLSAGCRLWNGWPPWPRGFGTSTCTTTRGTMTSTTPWARGPWLWSRCWRRRSTAPVPASTAENSWNPVWACPVPTT